MESKKYILLLFLVSSKSFGVVLFGSSSMWHNDSAESWDGFLPNISDSAGSLPNISDSAGSLPNITDSAGSSNNGQAEVVDSATLDMPVDQVDAFKSRLNSSELKDSLVRLVSEGSFPNRNSDRGSFPNRNADNGSSNESGGLEELTGNKRSSSASYPANANHGDHGEKNASKEGVNPLARPFTPGQADDINSQPLTSSPMQSFSQGKQMPPFNPPQDARELQLMPSLLDDLRTIVSSNNSFEVNAVMARVLEEPLNPTKYVLRESNDCLRKSSIMYLSIAFKELLYYMKIQSNKKERMEMRQRLGCLVSSYNSRGTLGWTQNGELMKILQIFVTMSLGALDKIPIWAEIGAVMEQIITRKRIKEVSVDARKNLLNEIAGCELPFAVDSVFLSNVHRKATV
jgi:hypothetical protein